MVWAPASTLQFNLLFVLRENRLLRSLECRLASACLEDSFEKWRNEIDIRGKHSLERAHHTVQVLCMGPCEREPGSNLRLSSDVILGWGCQSLAATVSGKFP